VVVLYRPFLLNSKTMKKYHWMKKRGGLKQLLRKITGQAPFEVDESFVFDQIVDDISDDERKVMDMFVDQSLRAQEKELAVAEEKEKPVRGFYRICNVPTKQCDDSPLENIEHPDRITSRKHSVFGHQGKMIHTDGSKDTKLTKVYKRGDNSGKLLRALKRMKLSV